MPDHLGVGTGTAWQGYAGNDVLQTSPHGPSLSTEEGSPQPGRGGTNFFRNNLTLVHM